MIEALEKAKCIPCGKPAGAGATPPHGRLRGADYRAPEKTARFPMERDREYSRFTGGGLYRCGTVRQQQRALPGVNHGQYKNVTDDGGRT